MPETSQKIMIISDAWHPQVNGVVRTYEHLKEELEKKGHTVQVIGPHDFKWRLPMPGYAEIELTLFPYKRLARMIDAFAPDIIHLAVEGPLGWAGRRYCMRRGRRYSSSYHTHFPHYLEERVPKWLPILRKPARKIGRWLVRSFHRESCAMMIASPSLRKLFQRWKFSNHICALTRGVNESVFFPGAGTLFKELKKPVALYVGRISVEKNLEAFLDMAWEGSKVIVGDGPTRASLEAKYPDACFVGKKTGDALGDHYRSADVFVFPSRTDTFGIVLIEALACGLPVAAYPVTGPVDIITEDFLGALDSNLSEAAHKALKNGTPKQRAAHVKKYYGWSVAADQFLAAFPHSQ